MTDRVAKTVVYTGRRQLSRGGLGYQYAEPENIAREYLFSHVKAHAVGHLYEIEIVPPEPGDDGLRAYSTAPKYTGEKWEGTDQIAVWQAIDKAAADSDRLRLAENRQKKAPELENAVADLLPMAKKCRNFSEIEALTNAIKARLMQEWHR